jgi:hypothetical protein
LPGDGMKSSHQIGSAGAGNTQRVYMIYSRQG